MQVDEANDQRVVRKRSELDICTNIQFDFQNRLWTDYSVSDFKAFTNRWETKEGFRKLFYFLKKIFHRKFLKDRSILGEL